jgi:HAMP domain-containing protein
MRRSLGSHLIRVERRNYRTEEQLMKPVLWLLSALLLLAPAAQTFAAAQKTSKQTSPIEQIKIKVAKLGVGEKARAAITTKDGVKIKGYVYSAGDEDFVMRDHKTAAPTTIRYADVAKVDGSRGHSVARNVLIIAGIGTAIVLASVYFAILRNER